MPFISLKVQANEQNEEKEEIFYTNLNGVELTKKQYNNLLRGFDEDTIATMEIEMSDNFKNNDSLLRDDTIIYVKVERTYLNGMVIDSTETTVSEEEYLNSDLSKEVLANDVILSLMSSGNTGQPTHETTYKKIKISVVHSSLSDKAVTLTNEWKQLPAIRSYDVLAIIPYNNSGGTMVSTKSGYQKWDGNTINYSSSSGNFKTSNGGVGLSQKLESGASTSITNSLTVYFLNSGNPFTARGSYQHATSNITLSQSQNYTLSSSGMGGVISFNSSVASYFDDTQGVQITSYRPF